jgi:serine/threonine protein kinase
LPTSNGANDSLIGRTIGNRYVVERLLGTGAMGAVYCSRQMDLGMPVALKVLHSRLATDPGLVQRFEREAFATSRLDHPNALRVLDCGKDGDLFYLVTEYVEAEDLLAIMEAEWPLSDERIVAILSQVLSALIAVHEIGIVHRDLKPENILVLAGQNDDGANVDIVKVCDFGIAKVATPSRTRPFTRQLTAEGVVVGTPDYMSPEQARGQAVDGRSDLYSVGVVLYHLLAGRTPFEGNTPVGIALQHVSDPPVPPSHHRDIHPGLEAVCLRALSKRPEDRFQTAREMRRALRDVLTAGPSATALARAPMTALRVGSNFSTSSPAMLSPRPLRQTLACSRFRQSERRRRRLSIGYAALASVATIAASAFVARRGSTTDPANAAEEVHMAMALVSPPVVKPPVVETNAPPMPDRTTEVEQGAAVVESISSAPPSIEPARRIASRGRSTPATKLSSRTVVVAVAPPALPVPPAPLASASPLLVRTDPWPSQADAVEAPPPAVVPPAISEARAPIEPRPAPAPRQPSARSFDSSRAQVGFFNIVTSAGISGAKVKVTLAHVPLLACYQQALRAQPLEGGFETELRLSIDVGGRVVHATLSRDGSLPGLRSCVEAVVRGAQIRDVDTGEGTATVQLKFSPR